MRSHLTRVAVVAALVSSSVAGLSLQSDAASGASPGVDVGSPGQRTVQPVVTAPAPRAHHDLPFGEATINPTTIVGGAPDQNVRVRIDFDKPASADRLLVRLYRPVLPDSEVFGRNLEAVSLGTRPIDLDDVRSGSARSVEFSDLNPPPGPYRVDVLLDDGRGSRRLVQRGELVVYAQHRLPPGAASGEDAKTGAERALPTDGVNFDVNFQGGNQAETFVAVQPNDPTRVIAAVNPGPVNPQAWISDESMRPGTAVERTLPSSSLRPADEGGGTVALSLCCDPALAADPLGNLWYSVLTTGGTSHIVVNRVAAGTTTFQANNVAIPRATTGLQDKNMMTIDNWSASPKFGMLYVVWTENPGQNVVISQCNTRPGGVPNAANCDTPANWSEPADITDGNATYTYSSVAAAPNGDVYVTWWDASNDNDVEIDRCLAASDCSSSLSWGADTDIDNLSSQGGTPLDFFCPIISAPGGRVGAITYVDVGPDGRVYVAYSDLRANGTTKCSASATDSTFESFIARGAMVNTFPAPNSGVRLSDDGATDLNDHFFPTLAVDPTSGDVESSLYSTKLDPTRQATHQFYVISTDDGVTYSAMTQITTESTDYSSPNDDGFEYGDYEGADSAQGVFYPVWSDGRLSHGGDMDLYILSPPVETTINSGPTGTTADSTPEFTFSSTSSPASFSCRVDGAPFAACSSPHTTAPLPNGPHTFEVAASFTQAPLVYSDPTPASQAFTVATTAAPTLSFNSPKVKEGKKAKFNVTRSGDTSQPLSVPFATANGTAKAPKDYKAVSGTMSFGPGETTKQVAVKTKDDKKDEKTEKFFLKLTLGTNVVQATAKIKDND